MLLRIRFQAHLSMCSCNLLKVIVLAALLDGNFGLQPGWYRALKSKTSLSIRDVDEFQLGPRMYASKRDDRDSSNGNGYYGERRRRRPPPQTANKGRRRGRGNYDDVDPGFFDEEMEFGRRPPPEDQQDESQGNDGVGDSLRKFYDAIFFYGLEVPESRTRRRRRGGGGERGGYPGKAAALRMSATKKRNPFYTASERAAEEYFTKLDKGEVVEETEEENDRGHRPKNVAPAQSRKPQRNLPIGERDAFAFGMDATERVVQQQRRARGERYSDDDYVLEDIDEDIWDEEEESNTESAEDTLAYIEDRLQMLEESLRRVEISIIELSNRLAGGAGGSAVRKDLRILKERRDDLEDNIEELKIEYVDIQSNML